ncbi:MAG: polysaccharide deacetylase [Clostridiales bacterium]|nr:polysaccharide deacetylase [Clostridiales bacterium]
MLFHRHRRRFRRKRRRNIFPLLLAVTGCVLLVGAAVFGIHAWRSHRASSPEQNTDRILSADPDTEPDSSDIEDAIVGEDTLPPAADTLLIDSPAVETIVAARRLAAGYDYDAALDLLRSVDGYEDDPVLMQELAGYEAAREALIPVTVTEVTHVFFHSLIWDPAKAFDGEADQDGYNQVMTTVDEFRKIIQSMYDKGYVLVRLHDLAYETVDENGNSVMKPGTILLPEGKIPFVMSQDDLCYYPYMNGDGFASRIVVGEDGKPTCEMTNDDGSITIGSYDLVPILEDFIQEHPDFSYRGARAVLAFTGYEGILGYRTSPSAYADSDTLEQDRQAAAEVAQCLRDHGWELASHSWGHLNLGEVEWERFLSDTDKWESEVETLIGDTDIILFPFGSDIGDWHPYSMDNDRFACLHAAGFRYFCNVDSSRYWVQIGDDWFRQGRRNLDGYRLWQDIMTEDVSARRLEDLFHAEDIFDSARPTPVPDM